MKYLMFVCTDTAPDTDPAPEPDIHRWVAENDSRGRRLTGDVLAPVSAATTVRVRNGELLLSDGPFAETKEVIVGFDLLDCADLDEAVEVARAHPMARQGRLELRPLAALPDQPPA
ncbi:YciI family protein [Micromonospora sp. NPDC050686]|uniref:YciI family protein n=1 Tax=Micromonospora sp. NPDC050686 TaxID=3154631 RepID=UPI0033DDE772